MDQLWQYIAIGLLVIGSLGYLGWHFWRKAFRKKSPCSSCGLIKLAQTRGLEPKE